MPSKERYWLRKSSGVCTSCGIIPPANNTTRCEVCAGQERDGKKGVGRNDRRKLRKVLLDHYGRLCVCCGVTEEKFLTLDHKNNDGNKHRNEVAGGRNNGIAVYRWLVRNNFPDMIQVLCFNCNIGKHLNNGVCPHLEFGRS